MASSSSATGGALASQSTPEGVDADDWRAIRAAYESGRHAAFAADDGYRARNPGQRWTTYFDGRGFVATPDAGDWSWGLDLVSYGWDGAQRTIDSPREPSASGARVAREWSNELTEWYVNDGRGLEHGYTVHARPTDATGSFSLSLAVRGGLLPLVVASGRDVRFVDACGGIVLTYAELSVLDADGRALVAQWTADGGGLRLSVDDRDARYPVTIDPLVQRAYLKASNLANGARFGDSVAASGDTIVVGAPFESTSGGASGAAYVFVRNGLTWTAQAFLKASNPDTNDHFGDSVAISGDTIVVGAPGEDSNGFGVNSPTQGNNSFADSGAAYVFTRSGTTWAQDAYVKSSNSETTDQFGWSVSISGDTVVVGANLEDSSATGVGGSEANNSASAAGAAYVFERTFGVWSQVAYLKASGTDADDEFGWSVSISDDTLVVGAHGEDSSSVGVNGNRANNGAANAGAAYVFVRDGLGAWSQQAYLKASNTDAVDSFGESVSVSGDTVVVGAQLEDSPATGVNGSQGNGASGAGAAYVFVRSGTSWSQQAYLKASNTEGVDRFGESVCVSGDKIVVGAKDEDSSDVGVDGNQVNNSATSAGATYLFVRSGTTWSQRGYVKATNTAANDEFGVAVAVDGDMVVVGASGEDSNATGVNGDQNNDSALSSGAAYVFEFDADMLTYCFGDGSLPTACPCSAPSTVPNPPAAVGHGCANNFDLNGALLSGSGNTSPDTLTISVDVGPGYQGFGFLTKGNATSGVGIANGDGVRCVAGTLVRFGGHNAGANGNPIGQWIYPNSAQTTSISAASAQMAGQTANYQLFYRHAAPNFCNPATTNWSNGLQVAWP